MAYLDDITAARDALAAELAGEAQRRAALVAAGNPPPATYSVSGKSVSWNEWLKTVRQELKELNAMVQAAGGDGGPIDELMRLYT